MIISIKSGGVGVGNRMNGFESCCLDMVKALVTTDQIRISEYGTIVINPSNMVLHYCPFCGEKVENRYEG